MNRLRQIGLAACAVVALAGCSEKATVEIRYDRPAIYEIDAKVRSLGIAQFGGSTPDDKRWGEVASDRLASVLDGFNKKYNRYQLVDRKRLKAILDERDLQAAFSDSSKAVEAGKVAHVDAMIYGTVTINVRDSHETRMVFDPFSQTTKPMPYTTRYVMAAVNFTIDNVLTTKTIATVSTMREYDSEKKKGGAGGTLSRITGMGGDKIPAADQLLSQLIDQCVEEFVMKISPHQICVRETLLSGKSDAVATGNKLAAAGDYAEAIEAYEAALKQNPNDHEAMFDAGVASEALVKLPQAQEYYDRAFKTKPVTQYVQARKRVRDAIGK